MMHIDTSPKSLAFILLIWTLVGMAAEWLTWRIVPGVCARIAKRNLERLGYTVTKSN